jgi:hypothetical protein
LEYFTAIWYNLWPVGRVWIHLVYFSCFGRFGPRIIWQPWVWRVDAQGFPTVPRSFRGPMLTISKNSPQHYRILLIILLAHANIGS